ncbi:MAG: hypothetical protein ABSA03_11945 [Streptosporangiaceae bacterium]|jgi:hypothetical protein
MTDKRAAHGGPVTKDGTVLTSEEVERLADEAEAGYDLANARLSLMD